MAKMKKCPCGVTDMDEEVVERFIEQFSTEYKAEDLTGIFERTKANFWDEDNEGCWELLHRIEALLRLLTIRAFAVANRRSA